MAKQQPPKKEKKNTSQNTPKPSVTFWIMVAVVFTVSFIFYAPSLSNEYALDDGITMEKNEYVHKGAGGIGEILTKDAYASFFKQLGSKGQLSGGRYRPLSIVTFAIEYDWFGFKKDDRVSFTGTDGKPYQGKFKKITPDGDVVYTTKEYGEGRMNIRQINEFKQLAHTQHFINVLLFAISMVALFIFFYQVLFNQWKYREYWALFATLVFAMHPLHSEVVANIKSRDEILSMLFILLTLLQFDRFTRKPNVFNGTLIGLYFFLAMLSKEYAAVLLIIIPVWAFIIQKKLNVIKIVWSLVPFIAAFIPYIILRLDAVMVGDPADVKPDVLNDYYLFAKGDEIRATQIYILLKYFLLQIFPSPLSSDYSWHSIPFRHFSSPEVIISILLHLGMAGGLVYAILKKNLVLSFALLFYLLNLLLISNLVFNIGASMGERLVYHSSLGLIILFFYGLYILSSRIKEPKTSLYIGGGITAALVIPFFIITMGRCAAWKNDYTLATTDVKTNPNSALLNANAGTYTIGLSELPQNKSKEKELVQQSRQYILKALEIHPAMANGWMNLAIIEHKLADYAAEEKAVKRAQEIFPNNPKIPLLLNMISNDYINVGFEKYKQGKPDSCFLYLYHAKTLAPFNPEVYYNLGGAYLSVARNIDSAQYYFEKTLSMAPDHLQAMQGLNSLKNAPNK